MTPDRQDQSPYSIVLTPEARRALTEELPDAAAFAAWEFIIGALAHKPRVVGTPLRAPRSKDYGGRGAESTEFATASMTRSGRSPSLM